MSDSAQSIDIRPVRTCYRSQYSCTYSCQKGWGFSFLRRREACQHVSLSGRSGKKGGRCLICRRRYRHVGARSVQSGAVGVSSQPQLCHMPPALSVFLRQALPVGEQARQTWDDATLASGLVEAGTNLLQGTAPAIGHGTSSTYSSQKR